MRRRRYPSDTTAAEWAILEPLLLVPACQTPSGGRPEAHPRREIVDAIRYVVDSGCKWRAVPADFPPWRTCYGFFARWAAAGVITLICDQLREQNISWAAMTLMTRWLTRTKPKSKASASTSAAAAIAA